MLLKIGAAFFIFLAGSVSSAYVGSVSAATGQAGLAAVEASESPFSNPAALAFLTGYYFSAGFGAGHQGSLTNSQDLAVSVTDHMRDTVVPTSLSYAQTAVKPGDNALTQDEIWKRQFKLSFGNFYTETLAFGFAIQHENDKLSVQSYSQTNFQFGGLWSVNKNLGFALVVDNLMQPNQDIPETLRQQQTIAIGGAYNYKRFARFKLDINSNPNNTLRSPSFGGGVESYMNKWLILRMGAQRNNDLNSNLYTIGAGFVGPKFGLHYAYQNSPQDESLTRHSVDLAIPIW